MTHLFDVDELGSKLFNLELPWRKPFLKAELEGIGVCAPLQKLLAKEFRFCDQADE